MGNASTSDQVINTTATDICDVLKNLSGGTYTIKINGEIDNETIIAINESLHKLNNLDTMINLDLSDTTSLVSIGNEAFYGCERLTSVIIPDSVTSIGDRAFCGCERLTSVTIPDSVTSIGDRAFRDCERLTSVTIPDSVTSIGDHAFRDCERLTTVNYRGTQEQWELVSIDNGNDDLTNATIIYNYTDE